MAEQAILALQQLDIRKRLLDREIGETCLTRCLAERGEKWGIEMQAIDENPWRRVDEQSKVRRGKTAGTVRVLERRVLEGFEDAVRLRPLREVVGEIDGCFQ